MRWPFLRNGIIFLLFTALACKKQDPGSPGEVIIFNDTVILNPSGFSPLSATVSFSSSFPVSVIVRVAGRYGLATDVIKEFSERGMEHTIPVLGLYADHANTVELIFKDAFGGEAGRKIIKVQTGPLPANQFPVITIDKRTETASPGMTLVSYYGFDSSPSPQTPFIFDPFGDIRWYLDFRNHAELNRLLYQNGMERLQNGNLYFGDASTDRIYECDMLGYILNSWNMPGYDFHHHVQEKPNGNFLVLTSKKGSGKVEDHIIELDRLSGQIIIIWDLNISLQNTRFTLRNDPVDWVHVNAVAFDPSDQTIIISGRTQGVIKLNSENKVVWILGCHKDWGIAGNGDDLKNYLLQPLDRNNNPVTDPAMLDGYANHADFEWNWYQHAVFVKPDGHLMLFDNGGNNRNYSGSGRYSRAVEYIIDKNNRTVRQLWEYGRERGASAFSAIVSDVDFLPGSGHVIFSPGAVNAGGHYGKIIEVNPLSGQEVFEATIYPPRTSFGVTFHRTERMHLYH